MKAVFTFLTTFIIFSYTSVLAQRKFHIDDLHKLCTLTDPQISPDGKSVLIVVSKPDTTINKNKTSVYR